MPAAAITREPDIILRAMLSIPAEVTLGDHLRALQLAQERARLEGRPVDPELELLLGVAGVTCPTDDAALAARRLIDAAAVAALMRIAVAVPSDWHAAAWWLEHRYPRLIGDPHP